MYKLFVSDFDGTLIDSDEAIPLSTMVEIDRIRKLGVKIVITTGRILKSILEYNKDFPFFDYVFNKHFDFKINLYERNFHKGIPPFLSSLPS